MTNQIIFEVDAHTRKANNQAPIMAISDNTITIRASNIKFEEMGIKVKKDPDYLFNENKTFATVKAYIDSTYKQHYVGRNKSQTLEGIISAGNGKGFVMGNLQKLSARYGKKAGYNKDDLLKIAHYAILALYIHEIEIEGVDEIEVGPNDNPST